MSSTIHNLHDKVIDDDSISTHDWSTDAAWTEPAGEEHSTFVLEPAPGQAIILNQAWVKFDAALEMHSPFLVQYCVDDVVVRTTTYKDLHDFIDRFGAFERLSLVGVNGFTSDILFWSYVFDKPVVLWSSGGVVDGVPLLDGDNKPKLTKIVFKIQAQSGNSTPYLNKHGQAASMARVRYPGSEICIDPDYEG